MKVSTVLMPQVMPPDPNCEQEASPCTPAELRARDLYEWTRMIRGEEATILVGTNERAAGGLKDAVGCIVHNNQIVTVTIVWQGLEKTSDGDSTSTCGSASSKRRQLELTAYVF